MGSAWQQRTRSYDGKNLLSYCFFARQFASRNLLPQPFQPAVIVVPCIADRLAQFGSDLLEGVALKKKQMECVSLAFREFGKPVLQRFFAVDSFRHRSLRSTESYIRI